MSNPTRRELEELDELLTELARRKHYSKFEFAFPDDGPLSREHYPNQVAFFDAGRSFKERAIIAGNRTGKTFAAMYEVVCHLTGKYPHWWTGYRFKHPVHIWCIGKSNESTKEILQMELIGSVMDKGSGLIPKNLLLGTTNRPGVSEAIMTARVQHETDGIVDGVSEVFFKSYEQGREALQGTAINFIAIDEEPRDYGIYEECLTRTLKCRFCSDPDCRGRIVATFTPFFGVSKVVRQFLPGGRFPESHVHPETHKWVCQLNLKDVPHMSQEAKDEYIAGIDPWMREVRIQGLPQLGSGVIYPINPDDIAVVPFKLPDHWPRAYALDVGWNKTAALWAAQDVDSGVWYIYSEHYTGNLPAPLHAEAIKSRGAWIPGVIDPASNRTRDDGTRLLEQYLELGLDVTMANNAVESGLALVWQMLTCGQLKVFNSCKHWFEEVAMYHKDENGKIPDNQDDHLMDCTRYFAMTGTRIARVNPGIEDEEESNYFQDRLQLGANPVIGY